MHISQKSLVLLFVAVVGGAAAACSSGDDAPTSGAPATEKAIGEACATNGECASGACVLGASGGTQGACTRECTRFGQNDPACNDPKQSGTCLEKGYCEVK